MLPSDMNLRMGKIIRYNNKILIASPSFKIGTNVKINLDGEGIKPNIKSNKEHKQDVKIDLDGEKDKPNIKSNREHKQDVKMMNNEPNTITYEKEKVALVLGITSVFTVWWMFK